MRTGDGRGRRIGEATATNANILARLVSGPYASYASDYRAVMLGMSKTDANEILKHRRGVGGWAR